MKNLKDYGVKELSQKNQEKTNGGFVYWWAELWGGFNFVRNSELYDDGFMRDSEGNIITA